MALHAQQIMRLLIIIIGIVSCFVIAESHEIVPNNKESWTPSYYYSKELGTNPSYHITSSIVPRRIIGKMKECLYHCILIEKYWRLRGEDPKPPVLIKKCINNCIRDLRNAGNARPST
ncbi:hypothetical protein PIB30_086996 [Stylosanthes scabra]|uniref:Uncharacterized protein n=1 Tax=Stylosanthes scabra TaxID=79078 RepID=A0ABU6TTW7_9FABA|nr:hypothetical protein [Stylosanthes scabra]